MHDTVKPDHLVYNYGGVGDGALEPPARKEQEHPCWDCAGEGAVLTLYDQITIDYGFSPAFSVQDAIRRLRDAIKEGFLHETCERHWRRGGVS